LGRAEHHANLVPWQFAAKKAGAKLRFIELDQNYAISTADLESKVSKKTAIVSVAHIPNTLAAINDVKEIARITHDAGALCMVDAAQSAPHLPLDVRKLDCDFMAFSGHKMCGPTGIGVLYGKEQLLSKMEPFLYGGSMIHSVSYERSTWNHLPDKFEAGTPPIGEAFGLKAAIEYLQKIGLDEIRTHERALTKKCLSALLGIDGVRVFGPKNDALQGGIVLFDFPKVGCHELALALDEAAHIAIRSGMHCAEPIVTTLNPKGVCRASFYLYNTSEEIEVLTEQLAVLSKAFGK
jgi:cysteine desulfurase/selenocysteine lyase